MLRARPVLWAAATVVLMLAVVAVVLLAKGSSAPPSVAAPPVVQRFDSRPDFTPSEVTVTQPAAPGTAAGDLFVAPKGKRVSSGPMILDPQGRLVWFKPLPAGETASDFRVQRYRGRDVLTWWEGRMDGVGFGHGDWVIADRSYHEIARVRAGGGLGADLHEFRLTPRGTALLVAYAPRAADLRSVGGRARARIVDSIVQAVDVATGKVRFRWRASDHVPVSDSYAGPPIHKVFDYDYFHVNSVALDTDGDYIVSARNTHAVYKLDRNSGKVLWRLGGKRSDYRLGPGVRFAWQHDVERRPDGTLTMFDNEATPTVRDESRALVLRLDDRAKTATVVRSYTHPTPILSIAEGNTQDLPNGNVLVGWGYAGVVSEFSAAGALRFDLRFPAGVESYRAYRFPWHATPDREPAVSAVVRGTGTRVCASWNGATEVTAWGVLAGSDTTSLRPVRTVPRAGFETCALIAGHRDAVAVRALAGRRELARSGAVAVRG